MTNRTITTRTEAVKVAEDVTLDELVELVNASRGHVTIFKPRAPRIHAYVTHMHMTEGVDSSTGRAWRRLNARYEYNTRIHGRGAYGGLSLGATTRRADLDPVFEFYNLGRVVRLSGDEG